MPAPRVTGGHGGLRQRADVRAGALTPRAPRWRAPLAVMGRHPPPPCPRSALSRTRTHAPQPARARCGPACGTARARRQVSGADPRLWPVALQFRVVKTNKRGKSQNRVIELNFTDGRISSINTRGKVQKSHHASKVMFAEKVADTMLVLHFPDKKDYKLNFVVSGGLLL